LFRSAQAPTSPPAEHASRGRYCATCSHKSTPTPTTHAYPKSKNSPGTPPQRRATTPTATATAGTTQPPEPSGVPRARHLGKPRRYLQQGALCPPVDGPAGAGAGPPTGWTPGPTGGRPHTGSAAPPALRDTAPPHRPHARAPRLVLTLALVLMVTFDPLFAAGRCLTHDYAVRRHGPAPSATRRQIILTCILNTTGLWCMLEVSEGAIAPPLDLSGRDSVGIGTNPTIGGIRGGHTPYR